MSTNLYAKPIDSLGSLHKSVVNSMSAKRLRTNVMECNTMVTDVLTDRDGNTIVETEYILLSETASQPAPSSKQSRLWVRSDTPTRAIFTAESGLDSELEPDLATVLHISENAENLSIDNTLAIRFTQGVEVSENGASGVSTSNTEIVVGHNSQSSAVDSTVLGGSNSTNITRSVVMGFDCVVTALAPSSNSDGTVCMGMNNSTVGGPCVVVGHNIVNASNNQDQYANVLIGSDITIPSTANACICIGNSPALPPASSSHFITIGNDSTATSNATQNIIAIGHQTVVAHDDDVVIGHEAQSTSNPCVSIGHKARSFSGQSISIGYNAMCAGDYNNVAIGANTLANGLNVIAIGHNASCVGEYSMVIGANSVCEHDSCYVIGAGISSRRDNEFVTRTRRVVGPPGVILNGVTTSATIFTYPTVSGDVLHVDGCVIGQRSDATGSFLAVLERFNFRNKNGVLTKSNVMGTLSQSQSDAGTGITIAVGLSGSNIIISATRTAGSWLVCPSIRIHAAPLE